LRSGELRLLVIAVTLAVCALSAVGFFSDRLKQGLQGQARQLLGGDAIIASDRPTPEIFLDQARHLKLQTASTLSFPTMARSAKAGQESSQLVALKAVTPGYPLRGTLELGSRLSDAQGQAQAQSAPPPGQAWVDAAVLQTLGLQLGDVLLLGNGRFQLTATIASESDRGAGFMNLAPRVLVHASDIAATGLIQPASRVGYRLAVAGDAQAVAQFIDGATQTLASASAQTQSQVRGSRLETVETGRPEMRQTLDRAEKFLNLVALLSALLSAIAVALSARAFAANHLDDCAMLRVLGLGQRAIASAYAFEFLLLGLFASALGVSIGYGLHHLFVFLMAGLIDAALPNPSWWPVGLSLGVGLTLLIAFGLPPILQLAKVSPLRVIRRDLGPLRTSSLGVLGLGLAGFVGLLLIVSSDFWLALLTVGGFFLSIGVFALLAWGALQILRRTVHENTAPPWLVLVTRQLSTRPVYAVIQVSALAVGLMALFLLVLLRTDLISSWRQATPADAPNRFVINIMPEQGSAFQQALNRSGVRDYDWFPMVRGRLIAINGQAITPTRYSDTRAQRLVEREFNLSYSAEKPSHNSVVAGTWQAEEPGTVSIEEGLAKTLNLQLGDRLQFDTAGTITESRISSLRKVDWSSLRVNFFALYPVSHLDNVPVTYISAFKAPSTPDFDNALVREFPNITPVDMTSTLNQVQKVLYQVIRAVEFLFAFTLAAGLIVLFSAITATRDERAREFAILRALGASAGLLRQMQRAELSGVGLLAGLLAAMVALLISWCLSHFVFEFPWSLPLWILPVGALSGAALALAAGWWGLRTILHRPVMQTLRNAQQ
jgi:putative ABC transport system permease protein